MTTLKAISQLLDGLEECGLNERMESIAKKMKLVEQVWEEKALEFDTLATKNEELDYSNNVQAMVMAKYQEEKIELEKEVEYWKKQAGQLTEEVEVLKHNLSQVEDKLNSAEKRVERYKKIVKEIENSERE